MKARIVIKDLEQSSNSELKDLSLKDMSNVKGGIACLVIAKALICLASELL